MNDNKVFVLDIGTRNVIGLIAQKNENNGLEILDVEITEHPERSMVGGQIHDIPKVTKIILDIKNKLEKRQGFPLTEVAVAAAGRALLSTYGHGEMVFPFPQEVTETLFYALQLEAVKQAQQQIHDIYKSVDYHCVGFSISHQYLDELPIGNLVGQVGKHAAVEIIATFLPRVVIDSLQVALQKAGLGMGYITLEPIAAMNLAVPENMRQLNIVLVDIGAGTSDIAISDKDTVKGYGMIPAAGDKITEILCQTYLLDFPTGEMIKRQLVEGGEQISFKDITGQLQTCTSKEILQTIYSSVDELATQISQKILEINNRPPQAVLCIGGGSLTPLLPGKIATELGLPENRVALIGDELAAPLAEITNQLPASQAITPLAIASDALFHRSLEIMALTVNNRSIRIFAANEIMIGDALVAAGISPSQYFGGVGPAITVEINEKVLFVKGRPGEAGRIEINGKEANLNTLVREGDIIIFKPGKPGSPGQGVVEDVIPVNYIGKTVVCNGEQVQLVSTVKLNGKAIDNFAEPIKDGDKINFDHLHSVQDLLHKLGYLPEDSLFISINGHECVDLNTLLEPDDNISISNKMPNLPEENKQQEYLKIKVNGAMVNIAKTTKSGSVILTDVFKVIDFNPASGKGKKLLMLVNGEPANFITPLKAMDEVIIKWQENNC